MTTAEDVSQMAEFWIESMDAVDAPDDIAVNTIEAVMVDLLSNPAIGIASMLFGDKPEFASIVLTAIMTHPGGTAAVVAAHLVIAERRIAELEVELQLARGDEPPAVNIEVAATGGEK